MPEVAFVRTVLPPSPPTAAGELGMSESSPHVLQFHDGTRVVTLPYWRVVEVDFGITALDSHQIVVNDPEVNPQSVIIATQSGTPATGMQADENELDQYVVNARPGTGTVTLNITSVKGSALQGLSRINYTVG